MIRYSLVALGLACCLVPAAHAQQTIYVNGTTGNDTWNGLCAVWDGGTCGPKATIQAGIDTAIDGDTVLVADGTYTGDGNKNLDFTSKLITLCSEHGPVNCIIDCEGSGRGFSFDDGETSTSVLDGFTITNGQSLAMVPASTATAVARPSSTVRSRTAWWSKATAVESTANMVHRSSRPVCSRTAIATSMRASIPSAVAAFTALVEHLESLQIVLSIARLT